MPMKEPFGLHEALTLYPTEEEFPDAAKYIESIAEAGAKYGIVKIVPPSSWDPPFCLDPETFTLITRTQNLSRMGLFTRATINWAEHLFQFHRQLSGVEIDTQPMLEGGKVKLNYYLACHFVSNFGGYEAVCKKHLWDDLARTLVGGPCGSVLARRYAEVALPYTQYLERVRKSKKFKELLVIHGDEESNENTDGDQGGDDDEDHATKAESEAQEDKECVLCLQTGGSDFQNCFKCRREFHRYCVGRLSVESQHQWWCPRCLCSPPRYRYDPGEEQTLAQFKKKCDSFKSQYIKDHMPNPYTKSDLEQEFWDLVSQTDRQIEVEYGADLVSEELGSGFPRNRKDEYHSHEWNLNKLGTIGGSLFRHLRKPISGVTSPWGYAGMLFSAFCWHSEDHFSYSINYHHGGATKTWYGVPSKHAARFEHVSRKLVPEEFEIDADVLSGRASLLPPKFLKDNGVDVFALDQTVGEFVVTFPNAYHAGFNHGYNFNEAVNYAPIDWLDKSRESAEYYRRMRHEPAFSHEELLYRSFILEKDPRIRLAVAKYLLKELRDEHNFRAYMSSTRFQKLRQSVASLRKVEQDLDTDGYHCENCKALPYFSRFRSLVNNKPIYHCLRCVCDPSFAIPYRAIRDWVYEEVREFAGDKLNELIAEVDGYIKEE